LQHWQYDTFKAHWRDRAASRPVDHMVILR
jgi:hypothetical protein